MFSAAAVGRFIGGVLAECGPVLVEMAVDIYQRCTVKTMEVGARRDDLRERLRSKLKQE